MKKLNLLKSGIAACVLAMSTQVVADVTIANLSYRTGPFAATGIPLADGMRDYIALVNANGGLGGAKIDYAECETGYSTEKGVECYEKLKDKAVTVHPWSTGITLQVIPKAPVDQVPILSTAYGLSAAAVGGQFPWTFAPPATYWDGATILLQHIAEGDLNSLKGKKIALLHLDHPYGKEPIPLLEKFSADYGFELLPIPVGLKEMQNQSSQWLQIRRARPDFVIMWGWGAMNAGAINEAAKTRFPMDKFLGIWWSGHDDDLLTVGDKATGYRSVSWNVPGNYPVLDQIREKVIAPGLSDVDPETIERTFYTRGIVIAMMNLEAIRIAQEKFGVAEVDAAQVRWGLEHLAVSEARLKALGMEGLTVPMQLSCDDHAGHHPSWILRWDGARFVKHSDLIAPLKDIVRPMLEEAADAYAKSNAPWPGRDGIACD